VQLITAIAPLCKHLTVFQRTPQYSVPARYGSMPKEFIEGVKADYENIWQAQRKSFLAAGFQESAVSYHDATEQERKATFESSWKLGGGFRFMFGTFYDIATSREANEAAAEFIRSKIRSIVRDEATARALAPTDLYAKRPICDMGYYETFNRDNVTLADIRESPIVEFTRTGIRTTAGDHDLDIVIFATGFEAVDGNYLRMDLRGRGGKTIQERWKKGATSYLGIATAGFPNMFMVLGSNSVFANIPPVIETQVELISNLIETANEKGFQAVEAADQAEKGWVQMCVDGANATLFPQAKSWIFGANIPGKPHVVMFSMSGLGNYRQTVDQIEAKNYEGFLFDGSPMKLTSASAEAVG
jgi:cation diffusion facilitator CzcD-associated flavoprotein CzcO